MDIITKQAKIDMSGVVDAFTRDVARIRTGRANANVLAINAILVDYYGSSTPLNQVAAVQPIDARLIIVRPWQQTMLGNVANAIRASDLGITPMLSGDHINLPIPALTRERRVELMKSVGAREEGARVAVRSVRRTALDQLKAAGFTEDLRKTVEGDVQDLTDEHILRVEEIAVMKVSEIMETD